MKQFTIISKLLIFSRFRFDLTFIFEASNQSTAGKLTKAKNTSRTPQNLLEIFYHV